MYPGNLFRRLVPPAPRPVEPRRFAVPLVLMAGFWGLWLVLEGFDVLTFSTRWPLVLGLLIPWFWWMHVAGGAGLGPWRGGVALAVRLALLALLAMILGEPRAVRKDRSLAVVFAMDASSSITPRMADEAMAFVARVGHQEKPETDLAGLVYFGRNAAAELPPRHVLPADQMAAMNVHVDRDGTDLAKGLALSAALLTQDRPGRIVLVSDGVATDGELGPVLEDLKARGIPVDVLPVTYDYEKEVWLERLDLPRRVKEGQTYEASVILSAIHAGRGQLVLQENGQTIFRDEVSFHPGKNRFTVPIRLREPGFYEYAAFIAVPESEDHWKQNNVAMGDLYLRGQGKVLIVTDPGGDERDWKPLAEALARVQREVEAKTAFELPQDALALQPYDCLILANVPRDAMDESQMRALHDAVKNQGIGLLMVGGGNSYGPGGYHGTLVEQALPVSMDVKQQKILPKSALAIILHTCEFPQGNTWAKRITQAAIQVLGAQDEAGVLVYDWSGNGASGERWLFPLTPRSELETKMLPLINAAQPGDMPDFHNTMKLGFEGLKQSDAASKHMIIISDGDPSPPSKELLADFQTQRISVSTVSVFPHGGQEVAVMRSIANLTGGRSYYPKDPNLLPSIFVKEAKTLRRSMIQNKTFTPVMAGSSEILKGVEALPPLHGYVLTSPKEDRRVELILDGPEEEELDPVLAAWRYGLGKSAAFTSDLSPNWAKDWLQWEKYEPFLRQLMTDLSRSDQPSFLEVRTFAEGAQGVIQVEDHAPRAAFLEVQAAVEGPGRTTRNVTLRQVGPGRYEGRFELEGEGRYQVVAAGSAEGRSDQAVGGFVVPYSREFLRFRADPLRLRQVAERTQGRLLTSQETGSDIFLADRPERLSSRPVVDWLLVLLACLIPLDVAVRRVQIDLAVLAEKLGLRRRSASGATMSALLKRKERVAQTLGSGRGELQEEPASPEAVAEARRRRADSQTATSPAAPNKAGSPAETDAGPQSTTSRLLAAKRKIKDGPPPAN